jgi:hypothetical protein
MILLKYEEMESWAVFLETKQKVTLKVHDIVAILVFLMCID